MNVEITKDEYGVQIWTDKEDQDHVIELETIEELIYLNDAIDDILERNNE
ncbi:hypothetical protein MUO98_05780 [Candidatus Bathyarchaeota archaeon]|nr:hypothetical protein [Candidatus Bathyarchaeota archaeon]